MIRIVQLVVTAKLSYEQAIFMQGKGQSDSYRARLAEKAKRGEDDLNAALNDGFTLLCSHVLEDDAGTCIAYTLYKPDGGSDRLSADGTELTVAPKALVLEDVQA